MKKISLFLMAILAFGLTSCDKDFIEPTPQQNPQEPLMSYEGLTVEKGEAIATALDLNTAGDVLQLIKATATPTLTETQKIEYVAFVSITEDFHPQIELNIPDGTISKKAFNDAVRELCGNVNGAHDVYIRFAAYLADGTSKVLFGDNKTFLALTKASITPVDLTHFDPVYIYIVGTPNGWDINGTSKQIPLKCDTGDEVYVGKVNCMAGENVFRFYTKLDGDWDTNSWGSQADDQPIDITNEFKDAIYNGQVVKGKGSYKFMTNGVYKLTVDLKKGTVKFVLTGENPVESTFIYMVGGINGWTTDPAVAGADNGKLACNTGDQIYMGTLTLPADDSGFSFFRFYSELAGKDQWDTGTIGTETGADEVPEFDGNITMFAVTPGKQGAFKVPGGTYDITVNLAENIVSMTKK
ncbi:MAG: hypothetical protein RSB34_09690 [Muribaculaceae bacterium]